MSAPSIIEARPVRYVWPLDGQRADETRRYLTYGREQDYEACPLVNRESAEYAEVMAGLKKLGFDARLLRRAHVGQEKGRCYGCGFKLKSLGWAAWEARVPDPVGGFRRVAERVEGTVRRFDTRREAQADCVRRGPELA